MNLTVLLTIIILVICVLLLGIKTLFVKGGTFPSSHVSGNKALRDKGLSCHRSLDASDRGRKKLEDRMNLKQ